MDFTVHSSAPRVFAIQNYFDAFGFNSDGVERPVQPIVSLQRVRKEDIVFYDEFPRAQLLNGETMKIVGDVQKTICRFQTHEAEYPDAVARVVDHIEKKFYKVKRIEVDSERSASCTIEIELDTESPSTEPASSVSYTSDIYSGEDSLSALLCATEFSVEDVPQERKPQTAYGAVLELTHTKKELMSFENYLELTKLTFERVLGRGGFGIALLAKDQQQNVAKVVKLIPMVPGQEAAILRELRIVARLSRLVGSPNGTRGYPKYYGSSVVSDRLSNQIKALLNDEDREEVEQEDCRKWLTLETDFGGNSLSRFALPPEGSLSLPHYGCAVSILAQVINALADGENDAWFEHRDCQWDNIVIVQEPDEESSRMEISSFLTKVSLPTFGIKVTLIDFGLSRCNTPEGVEYQDVSRENPEILNQTGTVQYEIYRKMQKILGKSWGAFRPETNAIWIDYLLDKLLERVRYRKPTKEEDYLPYKHFIEDFKRAVSSHDSWIQKSATGYREFFCTQLLRKKVAGTEGKN